MKKFFDDYLNIGKMIKSKQEYKQRMERVDALPKDYRYIFKEIQSHMWQFASGAGYDMMEAQYGLIELFEEGASEGKSALEVTGEDVAGFVDELLKNTRTYTEDWKNNLNRKIKNKFEVSENGKNQESVK